MRRIKHGQVGNVGHKPNTLAIWRFLLKGTATCHLCEDRRDDFLAFFNSKGFIPVLLPQAGLVPPDVDVTKMARITSCSGHSQKWSPRVLLISR